jgi:hypothetical protein
MRAVSKKKGGGRKVGSDIYKVEGGGLQPSQRANGVPATGMGETGRMEATGDSDNSSRLRRCDGQRKISCEQRSIEATT